MKAKFDFSKLTLQLIDVNMNNTPDVYVNKNCITFSKRAVDDMGYPAHVQYCIDPEHAVFAVRACKGNEAKAVPFSKPRGDQTYTVTCKCMSVHAAITKFIQGYSSKNRYKLLGHYDSESKIMFFDLNEAEVQMFRTSKTEE